MERFADRREAGRKLAGRLDDYAGRDDVVVLALPRGGVPVAYEIAERLNAPLDVFIVRKLGLPQQPELAMGAIASGDVRVLNRRVVEGAGVSDDTLERVAEKERAELHRREAAYRGDRPPAAIEGRQVLLVDDGLATGATMRAAVQAVRQRSPAAIVVAVPTAAPDTVQRLREEVDDVVCLMMPCMFSAIGQWYDDFSQTTDGEVIDLLNKAHERSPAAPEGD